MEVSFHKDGPLARLYKFTYELDGQTPPLPKNLCPFFWGIIFAIALFPLTLIGHLFYWFGLKDIPKFLLGLLCPLILICMISVAAVLILGSPLVFAYNKLSAYNQRSDSDQVGFFSEFKNLISTKTSATYYKICPSITWKNSQE